MYINDETNLNVNVQSIRIHGKLQIGSSKISFRFSNRINLMVFDGGMLEVLTSNHTWFVLPNSIITIYKNALLNSAQSTKFVSNSNSSYQALSSTINGPFTITVDLQGVIQNYSGKLNLDDYGAVNSEIMIYKKNLTHIFYRRK